MPIVYVDPDDHTPVSWDYAQNVLTDGETISTAVFICDAGITASAANITGGIVTSFIDVTAEGEVTCRATTSTGRIKDWPIYFRLKGANN
jgi:hypothetical protein